MTSKLTTSPHPSGATLVHLTPPREGSAILHDALAALDKKNYIECRDFLAEYRRTLTQETWPLSDPLICAINACDRAVQCGFGSSHLDHYVTTVRRYIEGQLEAI